ncbi:protein CsuC [Acinetobacter seifertii]|nr:protein CsuC [Acinetobacter seifertii]
MNNSAFIKNSILKSFLFASTLSLVTPVMAQATFLIWPIYPKIEANEKATAVWLQNTGKTDAMVQIRVFKWNQEGLKDNYSEQSDIIPSPPVAKIKAGEKHMLRLTKSTNLPDGKEQSYRLIVDELPIRLSDGNEQDASKVSFQMRYSIPLFAYGKGIGSGLTEESQKANAKNPLAKPVLQWSVRNNDQGQSELYLKNNGQKFARLSALKTSKTGNDISLGKAAFGYVLSNSTVKFSIDKSTANELLKTSKIYGVDSSGIKQELIEISKMEDPT